MWGIWSSWTVDGMVVLRWHSRVGQQDRPSARDEARLAAEGERTGQVDPVFKPFDPDAKVAVHAHDDLEVQGIACCGSRAKRSGITGGLGLIEDRAEASIACRQPGELCVANPIKRQEEMFRERISPMVKQPRGVRMVHGRPNTRVQFTQSDRAIEGPPQHGATASPADRTAPIRLRWHPGLPFSG